MSKGKGQKIAIKFDKPLLGDVSGNESAFTISGMQRNPLGVGELELKTYTPSTVERYPVATLYEDDFTGVLDGVEVGANGVKLNGESSHALDFDGIDDYVSMIGTYGISTVITAEAWIKLESLTALHADHTTYGFSIFSDDHPTSTSRYPFWVLVTPAGELRINTFETTIPGRVSSGAGITAGEWYHIAVTATKSGTTKAYVNGVEVMSFTNAGDSGNFSGTLYIGELRPTRQIAFNGLIDEVRIWNTVRTQQEIQDNMNAELVGNETGLSGYWKMDEGTGGTVADSAGNNNGTISGAAWQLDVRGSPGTYTTTTPADTLPTNPRLKWTEDLPAGTSITAEYAVNQDEFTTPETWTAVNNSDLLTIPDPATGCFLWLKFTLATTDTAVTPTLLSVWLEEAEAPPDTILLSFDTYNRFNDVEGDITVAYDQSLGTLAGTRPVESFSVDFTPADLEPTPIDEHTITAGIDLTVDLIDLEFTEIYADHNVTHTATAGIDVTVALINIEDINP